MSLVMALTTLSVLGIAPSVPEVTPEHLEAMETVREVAAAAADKAKPELLSWLDDVEFRQLLKEMAPQLANMSAASIHQRLYEEMQVMEVTHNFEPKILGPTYDLNINCTVGYDYLLNLWQLKVLELNNMNVTFLNDIFMDAETRIYKLKQITSVPNVTYDEASQRLIYSAMNWYKLSSAGSKIFGSVGLVLNNEHIRNYTAISPVDTGNWEESCGIAKQLIPPLWLTPTNCSAFGTSAPVPGTFDHWEHLITGNIKYWNLTFASKNLGPPYKYVSPQRNLAMMVARALNTNYPSIQPTESYFSLVHYSEASPLMNLRYKEGVKALLLNFTDLFGTGVGNQLQNWAIQNDWVTLWSFVDDPTVSSPSNRRFIDPVVLSSTSAGHNFTTDPSFPALLSNFTNLWDYVNTTIPVVPPLRFSSWMIQQWNASWEIYNNTILQVQPLFAGACSSSSCSATRVIDKKCVC
eukprot:TRINITY_DN15537_c0_g1_i1.p1 TRINITY_DN15537_c0_g1~~TRINITY_DN15537_c0_g1_i1.p1  ORF type:complete len:465 (+),score=80.28 TRINITY_DN15537_c0_g1_i1:53-1447(+)